MSFLIHINGRAAVGKKTIGTQLAQLNDARLVDNHTLINPASAIYEHGTPPYHALLQQVRDLAYDAIQNELPHTPFILTNCFIKEHEHHQENFRQIQDLASEAQVPFISVMLLCELNETLVRGQSPGRACDHKITDPSLLRAWRDQFTALSTPDDIILDVTDYSPEQAAVKLNALIEQKLNAYEIEHPALSRQEHIK